MMKPILYSAAILWSGSVDMRGITPCFGFEDGSSAGSHQATIGLTGVEAQDHIISDL